MYLVVSISNGGDNSGYHKSYLNLRITENLMYSSSIIQQTAIFLLFILRQNCMSWALSKKAVISHFHPVLWVILLVLPRDITLICYSFYGPNGTSMAIFENRNRPWKPQLNEFWTTYWISLKRSKLPRKTKNCF